MHSKGIDFAAAEDGQQLVDLYKDASDSPFHLICTDVQVSVAAAGSKSAGARRKFAHAFPFAIDAECGRCRGVENGPRI